MIAVVGITLHHGIDIRSYTTKKGLATVEYDNPRMHLSWLLNKVVNTTDGGRNLEKGVN